MADLATLQDQVHALCRDELWESAEILAGVVMCASRPETGGAALAAGPGSHARSLELFGDVMLGRGQHARALSYFEQAAQHIKHQTAAAPAAGASAAPDEARLKFKEARCHVRRGDGRAALTALERVPMADRTLGMQLLLGKLCAANSLKREAITAYKEALRLTPHALEAVEALVRLGVPGPEIMQLVTDRGAAVDTTWIRQLVQAHSSAAAHQTQAALRAFGELERRFPRNLPCLLQQARLHAQADNPAEAERLFAAARAADPLALDGMDEYAACVVAHRGSRAAVLELNALAQQLLAVDDRRPEPWVAVALYAEARGKSEKALGFADKAIALERDHVPAHQLRGQLLLALERPEHAVLAFFHAKNTRADLAAFDGLVTAYMASGKHRVALCTAKEAITVMPRSAQAVALVGRVLASSGDARDKAKRAFQKAIAMDPLAAAPVLALADLLVDAERDPDGAVALLRRALEHANTPVLRTKLADVLADDERFQDALAAYHHALSLDAAHEPAQIGLARLEKRMRGLDPDMPSDGESDEGDGSVVEESYDSVDYS